MCGIIGHLPFNGEKVESSNVIRGMKKMHHRGPDYQDFYESLSVGFGHCRLSIIDTDNSMQPMISDDKRYIIVFNGEIYNFIELRKDLKNKGVVFKTQGDTEVLLALYVYYGTKCLSMLNGMYAFAIWDSVENALFIARDRLGKKPLYYSVNPNGLYFASELPALLQFDNCKQAVNYQSVWDYFTYAFIPDNQSIFKDIQQLPPAHYLTCTPYKSQSVATKKYWSIPYPEQTNETFSSNLKKLDEVLADAVSLRLRSDVPLGGFLSGGIDSAVIVALMKKETSQVNSFTVGFEQGTFDERADAAISASILGTEHRDILIRTKLKDDLPKIVNSLGEPFADTSIVPTWYLCQFTTQFVTVALSGDGADELFAGYKRYQAAKIASIINRLSSDRVRNKFIDSLLSYVPDTTEYYGTSWRKKLILFLRFLAKNSTDFSPQHFTQSELSDLFNDDLSDIAKLRDDEANFHLDNLKYTEKFMYADMHNYLPGDILVKTDRMSMAHSLEVRSPFLDYNLVEFASQLPLEYKINLFRQKILLRKMAERMLPKSIIQRKKHGFASPVGDWLKQDLKEMFADLLVSRASLVFFNKKKVEQLWVEHQKGEKDHGLRLWSMLIFMVWEQNRQGLTK